MSYRSVKRVLGETRLELKCLILFAVCLLTLIGGSFWWYGSTTEKLVYESAQSTGRALVNTAILHHHMKNDPDQSPTFQALNKFMAPNLEVQEYSYEFIRPNSQHADKFESDVARYFPSTAPQTSADGAGVPEFVDRRPPDKKEYQYFQPIYLPHKLCAGSCHAGLNQAILTESASMGIPREPLKVGDLMAIAKITLNDDATQASLNGNRAVFMATGIITVFLAMIASYVIVRYVIVKPLKHLRDTSEEIMRGNMEARADIHTADEFEELGVAFNKMVRHMVTAQDDLKHLNGELDGKVDELAQTNMRLYEMNRLKSDFLATMSHELRTPLNSIIGFSEVLDSIKSLDDKQRRYVQNIQKSGRVLLDMINDILDLAKIESGKMEVRLSDFRIEHLVHAQCDFVRPQTERKNIDLDVDVEPGLPELFQDQVKVQQILSNLLSNAIKFTPEGGRIVVTARQVDEGEALVLTVVDTGVGIAETDQVAIFEKFRQGQAVMTQGDAITREYSGTGLGLSIVKELCKLLGGEVSVESQIGRGSTFTVHLPWTVAGHAKFDEAIEDNMQEMLRPQRQEMQRTLERAAPAPVVDR